MLVLATVLILTLSDVLKELDVICQDCGWQEPRAQNQVNLTERLGKETQLMENSWNPDSKLRMLETTWVGGYQVPPLGDQNIKIEPKQPGKNQESHIYQSNWWGPQAGI